MTTPLQKAAQALLDCDETGPIRKRFADLRKALDAEIARPESTAVSRMRAERDAMTVEVARLNSGWCKANEAALEAALKADALKDAARMALDVCIEMRRYGNQRSVAMAIGAEAALKAVL